MSSWGKQESAGGKAGQQGGASTANTGITGPKFDALHEQKRSKDPSSTARRESLAEQRPTGFIGQAFKNFISGPEGSNTSGK